MNIILNNRDTEIEDKETISIKDLFEIKKFVFPHIIVKVNGKLVRKGQYADTILKNGDKIDAIHLIGGG